MARIGLATSVTLVPVSLVMTTEKNTIPKLRTRSADSVRPSRRDPVTRSASPARTGASTTARSAGSVWPSASAVTR